MLLAFEKTPLLYPA